MSEPVDIKTSLLTMLSDVENATSLTTDDVTAIDSYVDALKQMSDNHPDVVALGEQIKSRAASLVEMNAALTFQVVAIGSIATTALEQSEGEKRARIHLEDALAKNNTDHPLVADHAEIVQEEMEENFKRDWEKALEENYDILRAGLVDRIMRLTWFRLDTFVTTQFVDALLASGLAFAPSEYQREMLAELVASFADEKVNRGA
jgi:hypothetical protein